MLSKKDWKEIIYRNGKINATQVFKELEDYAFLMEQASKVYCHFCNLGKTNYHAETIIGIIEDNNYDKKITQEDVSDMIKNCESMKELRKELKDYFDIDGFNSAIQEMKRRVG